MSPLQHTLLTSLTLSILVFTGCYEDIDYTQKTDDGVAEFCFDEDNEEGDFTDCQNTACRNHIICTEPSSCQQPERLTLGTTQVSTYNNRSNEFTPTCVGLSDTRDEVFSFVVTEAQTYCARTTDANFDTVLSVRTTCQIPSSELACNDDGGISTDSALEWDAEPGIQYIIVDGYGEEEGTLTLHLNEGPCHERSCTDGIDDDDDGLIDCADNDCAQHSSCREVCGDGLDNDVDGDTDCDDSECKGLIACICESPEPITEGSFTNTTNMWNSTSGNCAGDGLEHVRLLTVATTTTVCIDTFDTDFDTVLYVRNTCGDATTEIICNDDTFHEETSVASQIEFEAIAGESYYIFFDTYGTRGRGMQAYNAQIRFGSCTETTCDDGLDDDNDGAIDCEDSDCVRNIACLDVSACDDPESIEEGSFTSTTGTRNNFESACGGNGTEDIRVLTTLFDHTICIDTFDNAFDMTFSVRTTCIDETTEITCNNNRGGLNRSKIEFEAVAGEPYYIFFDTSNAGPNNFTSQRYNANVFYGPCTETICDDGLDNDGDGFTDCDDPECANNGACVERTCNNGLDDDNDGDIDCADTDCFNQSVCQEVCDDGLDNNQDDLIDCDDPICLSSIICADTSACEDPEPITESSFTGTTGTRNNFESTCNGQGSEEVRSLIVENDTTVCINTFGSPFDTVLYVRNTCNDATTEFICNDDTSSEQMSVASQIEFEATAGTPYYIFFDTYAFNASLEALTPQEYTANVSFAPCSQ